jgi:hypothetical protein
MTEINRCSVLALWEKSEFIPYPVKGKCAKCGNYDFIQHQEYCVECMVDNAKFNQKLQKDHEGKCAMCDKKLTDKESEPVEGLPYLRNNVCNKCLKASF